MISQIELDCFNMEHLAPMATVYRPEWGSDHSQSRPRIREYLLHQFGPDCDGDILDLSRLPELRSGYLSISHCPGLGGFAFDPHWVGFDIEVTNRVTPELAARIGNIEEFAAAPNPAALWCAKEAIFKALRWAKPPQVVMDLQLQWLSGLDFELQNHQKFRVRSGRGRVEFEGPFTLARFSTTAL